MIIEIKKPLTRAKLLKAQRTIKKHRKKKGFNPDPFLGKIKWPADGLKLQRIMRDEWN